MSTFSHHKPVTIRAYVTRKEVTSKEYHSPKAKAILPLDNRAVRLYNILMTTIRDIINDAIEETLARVRQNALVPDLDITPADKEEILDDATSTIKERIVG